MVDSDGLLNMLASIDDWARFFGDSSGTFKGCAALVGMLSSPEDMFGVVPSIERLSVVIFGTWGLDSSGVVVGCSETGGVVDSKVGGTYASLPFTTVSGSLGTVDLVSECGGGIGGSVSAGCIELDSDEISGSTATVVRVTDVSTDGCGVSFWDDEGRGELGRSLLEDSGTSDCLFADSVGGAERLGGATFPNAESIKGC
jgi:hypothetical protein